MDKKEVSERAGGPLHFPAEDELKATESMKQTIIDAKKASENEQNMTLMQGLKLYPKAAAWSILISTCIAMEGYQVSTFFVATGSSILTAFAAF